MRPCPECAEPVDLGLPKCPSCGAALADAAGPESPGRGWQRGVCGGVVLFVGLALSGYVLWAFVLNQAPHQGCLSASAGALRRIHAAQQLFLEADKDGDGVRDFGSLEELRAVPPNGLLPATFHPEEKGHYTFWCVAGSVDGEPRYFAVANHVPGGCGDVSFCINQEGDVYTTQAPIGEATPDCSIPADGRPSVW